MEICHRSLPVACFVSNCGNNESHESFPDTKIMNFTELWSLPIKNRLRLFTLEAVQYIGGITSVLWGDSFSTVGVSFSTVEVAQYSGE